MANEEKLSALEGIKQESQLLRGEISTELGDGTDHFSGDSVQLLKHHGTYQQDNRDERAAARAAGQQGKKFSFLIRTRVPGGLLNAAQLLAELALGDEFGDGTLRITSRQGLQLHGVLKGSLREVIRRVNDVHLTTLGACGDVNRNVMCCPAPYATAVHQQMQTLATELAHTFAPRTGAYHDIWLWDRESGDKQLVDGGLGQVEEEPLYGRTYLPRKFKMGIALPDDNCIDIYTHDLGLLAIVEQGQIVGYNLLVGGGMGVTPSNKKTFPALGKRLAFVTTDQVVDVAKAVVSVQRDYGNRSDRKVARLKYLIDNIGVEEFRGRVQSYYGGELADPHPTDVHGVTDHIGWEPQGDGRWYYGLNIENGRIADTPTSQLKTALREICTGLQPGIRLTAHQSLLFTDVAEQDRNTLEELLKRHNVPLSAEVSTARRWSMACVAWPTCGLAITESERALPGVIDQMEDALHKHGLEREAFTVRMTGCPNGCARPYNADIGLVGKARNRYSIFVGGSRLGTRLNFLYKDLVPQESIVPTLEPLFAYFRQDRDNGEAFGDFCHRKGLEDLLAWSEQYAGPAQ